MLNLKKMFHLSDRGYRELKKGIAACTLTNITMMIPVFISVQIFVELIKPLTSEEVSWKKIWILAAIGLAGTVGIFFASKNDYRKTYVNSYLEASDMRIRIAEIIRELPMKVFNSKNLTELTANMMSDCAVIEHTLSHVLPPLVANIISVTLICIGFAFFDWRMALALFITLPVSVLIILLSRRRQDRMSREKVNAKLRASEQTQEYIAGIKIIKSCFLNADRFSALKNALDEMRRVSVKMELGAGVLLSGAQFVLQAGIALTVYAGVTLFSGGTLVLSTLVISLMIAVRVYGPIITTLTLMPEIFHMQVCSERVMELSNIEKMEGSKDTALDRFDIDFDHVSFGYQQETEVLHDVNFRIPEGKITALVGPSGSGKSTVAKLISRFWDVTDGSIRIGGTDLRSIDPEHLTDYVTVVFQDVILFNDTVFNNIKIGNMNATDEEVMRAAKLACCDEFVSRMPDGYQTLLGENGNTVSGGERQRISIARALLKNAPIVILDEATASLDPENEVLIQDAISGLTQNKTVLVIAHRLRTVTNVDQIIVMENGRVAESGTHDSLTASHGLYDKLFSIQQQTAGWNIGRQTI
ncbi:MAG: ABC transporter ATP-binding protein [Oscillospiraceae bacterium]|nr:ABC transporter ATP-binding protein [Oscillospiraceae bacterium]